MIRTFQKKSSNNRYEVVILDTETNRFEQFFYEMFRGKLVKFAENVVTSKSKYPIDCNSWLKNNRKWFKYVEVNNNLLDGYQLWNTETDLTEDARKEILCRKK